MDIKNLLFECIRHEIDENYTISKENITDKEFQELYQLAAKHDLAHFVSKALKDELENSKYNHLYYECMLYAVYRYEQKRYVREQISKVFEEEKIPHIFLKGSVLAEYYPEPWLRTSCDIDIYVHKNELKKAIEILIEKLDFAYGRKDSHGVSLLREGEVNVEIHYHLIEVMPKVDVVISRVWETSKLVNNLKYEYVMSEEMFYFYHIAHMAKHLAYGGCGVRSLIDIWILNHSVCFDGEKRKQLLGEGNLLALAEAVENLAEVWFGNCGHTNITKMMEQYILEGGTYGNLHNKVLIKRSQYKSKLLFIIKRIFMPNQEMKLEFPILKKFPFLLPLLWVVRWGKCLSKDRVKHAVLEFQLNSAVTIENQNRVAELVEKLELDVLKD